jgi:hypothetical protein
VKVKFFEVNRRVNGIYQINFLIAVKYFLLFLKTEISKIRDNAPKTPPTMLVPTFPRSFNKSNTDQITDKRKTLKKPVKRRCLYFEYFGRMVILVLFSLIGGKGSCFGVCCL